MPVSSAESAGRYPASAASGSNESTTPRPDCCTLTRWTSTYRRPQSQPSPIAWSTACRTDREPSKERAIRPVVSSVSNDRKRTSNLTGTPSVAMSVRPKAAQEPNATRRSKKARPAAAGCADLTRVRDWALRGERAFRPDGAGCPQKWLANRPCIAADSAPWIYSHGWRPDQRSSCRPHGRHPSGGTCSTGESSWRTRPVPADAPTLPMVG